MGAGLALAAAGWAQSGLTVETVEGEGAVYNLRSKSISLPRVRVFGADGKAASGAFITFRLPDSGPGGTFADGRFATVTANEMGEAAVPAVKLNALLGPWEIRVSAAHAGMVARGVISQISAAPVEAITMGGKRTRSFYWLALAAAGAATLVTVGFVSSGSTPARPGGVGAPAGTASAPVTSLTITPGAGTIGAP
jgi:hypothetical protein